VRLQAVPDLPPIDTLAVTLEPRRVMDLEKLLGAAVDMSDARTAKPDAATLRSLLPYPTPFRHARACRGYPRDDTALLFPERCACLSEMRWRTTAWVPATSAGMTAKRCAVLRL